ncbi:MAG: aspartate--tRNA ligase, partial [Pseudomonadota bacterium]
MEDIGFTEYSTPILTASSPEGARDFLVPSRIHPGKFFALPQAPQQYKQLLMVAGFDRYFQIAPCFRDEDPRADRLPGEFYQLDLEMSFVTQEEVWDTMEPVMAGVFEKFADGKTVTPAGQFPRIPHAKAMLDYGTDKPDLRNPLIIHNVTGHFTKSGFGLFERIVEGGGVVRAIPAPKTAEKSRKFFDDMNELAAPLPRTMATKACRRCTTPSALVPTMVASLQRARKSKPLSWRVPRAHAPVSSLISLKKTHSAFAGSSTSRFMNGARKTRRSILPTTHFRCHKAALRLCRRRTRSPSKPINMISVSGSIRNQHPDLMVKAFELTGLTQADVEDRFGGMYRAFQYGAPPHGGMAAGVDRMVMLLCGVQNLREITLFPMNQRAEDLLMGAPSPAEHKQLRELNIRVVEQPPKAQS